MNVTRSLGSLTLVLALGTGCGSEVTEGTGGGGAGGDDESGTGASTSSPTTSSSSTTNGPGVGGGEGTGGDTQGVGGSGAGTGGDGSGGDSSGGSGTGGSGAGGGATAFPDDCASDADCPDGTCTALASGFRTCRFAIEEATFCGNEELDTCCSSDDCPEATVCTVLPDQACGGAPPNFYNACVPADDTCADLDCAKNGSTCIPSGVYGNSVGHCVAAGCGGDEDCDADAGGRCVPVAATCCSAVVGLFCAYPGDGCRRDADCGDDSHCAVDESGRARCAEGPGACPP